MQKWKLQALIHVLYNTYSIPLPKWYHTKIPLIASKLPALTSVAAVRRTKWFSASSVVAAPRGMLFLQMNFRFPRIKKKSPTEQTSLLVSNLLNTTKLFTYLLKGQDTSLNDIPTLTTLKQDMDRKGQSNYKENRS